jgi:hypothetical protein
MMMGGIVGGAEGGPLGPFEHSCALRWRCARLQIEDID